MLTDASREDAAGRMLCFLFSLQQNCAEYNLFAVGKTFLHVNLYFIKQLSDTNPL